RRSMRGARRSSDDCRSTRSFSAPLCSLIWLQVERACSFGPIARAILDQFLELDLGVGDAGDDAEVLAHVIAGPYLVDVLFRCPNEAVDSLSSFERADHRQPLERISLERLSAPREIGCESVAALRRLDLSRLERVRQIVGVVRERLVRLDLW